MARYYRRQFQCTDENCGKVLQDKFKWDDDLTPVICECGQEMFELLRDEVPGSPAYLKFSSMTPEAKKSMLTKRSHDHFNREIKERKHQMQKDMLRGMTGGSR